MKTNYHSYIKSLRLDKGYSQDEVAEKIGISRQSYLAVEHGKRELSLGEADALSQLLGITVEELMDAGSQKYEKYKQMLFMYLRANMSEDGKIPKTKLAKLLYFADFAWFYENLESMSGLKYRKIEHGPVPDYYFRLLEELEGEGKINISPKGRALLISQTRVGGKVGDELLSTKEKNLIKKIAKKWRNSSTGEIVDFAHDQLPYRIADDKEIISYSLITQEDPEHVY